jgi:hypothetical protein
MTMQKNFVKEVNPVIPGENAEKMLKGYPDHG